MTDQEVPLLKNHVITRCRNGRCYYEPKAKEVLVRYAAMPGVSLPELARRQGISLSQLRRWVREYEQQNRLAMAAVPPAQPAFIPVTVTASAGPAFSGQISIRLPNGIFIDIPQVSGGSLSPLLEALYRLPCSVSTLA